MWPVAPIEVVPANIPHLNLPAGRVVSDIGEHTALKRLHQHALLLPCNPDICPVWLRNRVAQRGYPVHDLPLGVRAESAVIDGTRRIHEGPEDVRYVVTEHRLV